MLYQPAGGADLRVAGVDPGPVPKELQECAAVAIVVPGNLAFFAVSARAAAGAPGIARGAGAMASSNAGCPLYAASHGHCIPVPH